MYLNTAQLWQAKDYNKVILIRRNRLLVSRCGITLVSKIDLLVFFYLKSQILV